MMTKMMMMNLAVGCHNFALDLWISSQPQSITAFYMKVESLRADPVTSQSQVQHLNHYTTMQSIFYP